MGKSTDVYMTAINKLNDTCMEAFKVLLGYSEALKTTIAAMARNLDDQAARVREVTGVDPARVHKLTPQQEEAANSDAVIARLGRDAERLLDEKLDYQKSKREADDTVCDAVNNLSRKVDEFRTFVRAKEASRDPFKSKKSVPAAKEFLKKADETIDSIVRVTRSLR